MDHRKKVLGKRSLLQRYPVYFIVVGTVIGCSMTWAPMIYSATHTEDDFKNLKTTLGSVRVVDK